MDSETTGKNTSFSAADSALGYLYQVRLALLWALRRADDATDFMVSLETLDDVTFTSAGGTPEQLLQAKHHQKREASLTNASVDLWKSLRVWFEGHTRHQIPSGTALYLLTTGSAPKDSAAWFLRSESRDVQKALAILDGIPHSSQNATNAPAYAAFLAASPAARRALLDNVVVLDRASSVITIEEDIRREIRWSSEREHREAFMRRLEGWWLDRVIEQLTGTSGASGISSVELEHAMADLREQFKPDNLPIDPDLLNYILDESTKTAHAASTFVHQLRLIEATSERIATSIRNYYRAFEQRSRWMREHLLLLDELSSYDARLVEEWEQAFQAATNEIDATAPEDERRRVGRKVLTEIERLRISVRNDVTETFVVRGSFHMLADEAKVGWHPNYRDRVSRPLVLETRGSEHKGGNQ
jgi:hypothetical protein